MRKYSDFPVHQLALRLLLATASASFVAAMSGCDRGQPPAPSPTPTAIAPAPAGGHSAGALTSCLPGTDGGSRSVPGDPAPTPSARDGQNPAGAWHFSYVATQSSEESWKSTHDVHIRNISACGKGSMVVDAPPEQDGQVIINTEQGDPVTSSAVNGTYRYHESDVRTGLANELEGKRIDDYSGTP
ncbi:MAG TPA: hypothetical protein VN043_10255, partial [Rhodanobacter sp.]|nr:hypothetical protein [Rhodanobacter sp.]